MLPSSGRGWREAEHFSFCLLPPLQTADRKLEQNQHRINIIHSETKTNVIQIADRQLKHSTRNNTLIIQENKKPGTKRSSLKKTKTFCFSFQIVD